MTQDTSSVAKPTGGEQEKAPEKQFFIVEILKKLLEYNQLQYGTRKKF